MEIKEITTRDDFNLAKELWQQTGIENPARGDSFDILLSTISYNGKLLGLFDNNFLIGTVWLTDDGRRLYLHHMAIDQKYQGKGLANILMDECIKIAQNRKRQIKLEVHKNNNVAINLYQKYNFDNLGDYFVMINRKTDK